MMALFASIERTALSVWVRESPSLLAFPFILYLHTLGLAMLAGINVGLDVWLLAGETRAVVRPAGVFRVMWLGFGVNALSGFVLLVLPREGAHELGLLPEDGVVAVRCGRSAHQATSRRREARRTRESRARAAARGAIAPLLGRHDPRGRLARLHLHAS